MSWVGVDEGKVTPVRFLHRVVKTLKKCFVHCVADWTTVQNIRASIYRFLQSAHGVNIALLNEFPRTHYLVLPRYSVIGPENLYTLTYLTGADPVVPCEHLRSYLSMSGTPP